MKYGDESYLNEVKLAKNDADYSPCEALLAAEAECEKLRKQLADSDKNLEDYFDRNEREKQRLRHTLEEYHTRYGKINHVEQEEMK